MRDLMYAYCPGVYHLEVIEETLAPRYRACLTDGYDGSEGASLGSADSLDEALSFIFSYLASPAAKETSCNLDHRFKLEFKDSEDGDYVIVDFGDPFIYGRIHIC